VRPHPRTVLQNRRQPAPRRLRTTVARGVAVLCLVLSAGAGLHVFLSFTAAQATRPRPPGESRAAPVRAPATPRPARATERPAERGERIEWRRSRSLGHPANGRLVDGVRLPSEGRDFFTWDPIERRAPNRGWRRNANGALIRLVLRVAAEHRRAHPGAPRLAVGDMSRPHGGDFGARFGSIGHGSHQNGLDVDIYYPRLDRRERSPRSVAQVDIALAQDLVDRFVRAGARFVFVGPSTRLRGPRRVVQALPHHDNHIHVRIPTPA